MTNVHSFPFTLPGQSYVRANVGMADAPRDGSVIWVMVAGPKPGANKMHREHTRHWLPFGVRFANGRWCYALYDIPLHAFHEPLGWQSERPEGI